MARSGPQDNRLFALDLPLSIREAVLLLLLAATATTASWALRGDRLPLAADREAYELEVSAPLMDIAEALVLFDEGDHLFIDTHSDRAVGSSTILGAFRIRAATLDDDLYNLSDTVFPEDPIILFGNGDLGGVAHVADLLLARGFEDIIIMRGGVAAWQAAGGEVSPLQATSTEDSEAGP